MKNLKQLFLAILSIPLAALLGAPAAAAQEPALKFGANGEFKILQIADMHLNPFRTSLGKDYAQYMTDFFEEAVARIQPDLVVLTGDNIQGLDFVTGIHFLDKLLTRWAIDRYMRVFEALEVPVAVVFGNHDEESGVGGAQQLEMYRKYKCCVAYSADPSISRASNYNLPIYGADGAAVKYNLWMLDSGMEYEAPRSWSFVKPDQVQWYVEKSNELKAANGGVPVPSMLFQHIVVKSVYDALLEVPQGTEGAVESVMGGHWYVLDPANAAPGGVLGEPPSSSKHSDYLFPAAAAQGDVRAMVFGHDHENSFVVRHQGIDLINTPIARPNNPIGGVRVITIRESDASYETRVDTFREYLGYQPSLPVPPALEQVFITLGYYILWPGIQVYQRLAG